MLEPTNPNLAIARRIEDAGADLGVRKKEVAACLGLTKSGYMPYEKGHHNGLTEDEDRLLTVYRRIKNKDIKRFVLDATESAPKE